MILAALPLLALAGPPDGTWRSDLPRPTLSGPELTLDSDDGFFRVHYTLEGADRVASASVAQRTLDSLELGRTTYRARGYRELVPDTGTGGSDALDVYLVTVDINGYAHGIPISGETHSGACWIEVDGSLGDAIGVVLESVVVHELHHCVQYRYTWNADSWVHEATSTYEQYLTVSDAILDIALAALWSTRLQDPDWPIDDLTGRYEYAGFVWMKLWEELGGYDPQRSVRMWEALDAESDWRVGLDTAARQEWGLGLDEVFLQYATYNGFACGRDDGAHYSADRLACLGSFGVPVEALPDDGTAVAVTHEAASHTAAYLEVAAGDDERSIRVDCGPLGEDQVVGLQLVALDAQGVGGEAVTAWATAGETLSARLERAVDPQGGALAVLASTGSAPMDVACTASRLDPLVVDEEPVEECGCASGRSVPLSGAIVGLGGLLALLRRRRAPGR